MKGAANAAAGPAAERAASLAAENLASAQALGRGEVQKCDTLF